MIQLEVGQLTSVRTERHGPLLAVVVITGPIHDTTRLTFTATSSEELDALLATFTNWRIS